MIEYPSRNTKKYSGTFFVRRRKLADSVQIVSEAKKGKGQKYDNRKHLQRGNIKRNFGG